MKHGERERGGQRTNLMISHAPLFSQHSARWTILITVASMLNYKNKKVVNVKYSHVPSHAHIFLQSRCMMLYCFHKK